jgi:cytochrome c
MLVTYLKSLPVPDVVPTQSWIEPRAATEQPNRNGESSGASAAAPAKRATAPAAAAVQSDNSAAAPSAAIDLHALLQINGCTACHSVDTRIVGPAFKDVAAKYRGQSGAEQKLFASAKNGSTGVWGSIPMPPNPAVKDEDLHAIVKQILSLK